MAVQQWANVLRVRNDGVPVVGFTWYSLTDQVDWDVALRERCGRVNPLGLHDLDRRMRRVGRAYQRLIADWRDVLPAQSLCLHLPVHMLRERDGWPAGEGRDPPQDLQSRPPAEMQTPEPGAAHI